LPDPILHGEAVDTELDRPAGYAGGAPEDPFNDPGAPREPNSFYFPFWGNPKRGHRRGYISWQSDNPIAVLALIMLVLVLIALGGLSILNAFFPLAQGVEDVMKVLGQAVLTLVGVIGGAASSQVRRRGR
jgi:hypothetical protein